MNASVRRDLDQLQFSLAKYDKNKKYEKNHAQGMNKEINVN